MIIGNGDVASQIDDRDDVLFFASGISNSAEVREEEYAREIELLSKQPRDKRIVYFGSLSMFYANNRYTQHKQLMESLVKQFPRWTIFRIGTLTWGKNPHTLINHLRAKYQNGEDIELQDVYRYVLEPEEFKYWLKLIPDFNCEMNVTGKRMKVKDIFIEYVINNNS